MDYQTFYVNREAATSADTLLALGWAALLRSALQVLGMPGEGILISNTGPTFEVKLPALMPEDALVSEKPLPLLELFMSAKQDERQAKKGRTLQDGFVRWAEREAEAFD